MKDQAERLRELMAKEISNHKKTETKTRAKVLTITSGKGGVGKTNFAVNLAISIQRLGYDVLILDADIGLSNVEILVGMNMRYNITDFIVNNMSIQDIIGEGPEGIKIISGGSGLYEFSTMNDENIKKILNEFKTLEQAMDFIIIDTGAGVSNTVLDFVITADEVIIVTTPDPTSIMDGYTMIKALTMKDYKGKLNIVVNVVSNRIEAERIFFNLRKVCNSFLKVDLHFLGYLENSKIINKSIISQKPFLISSPRSTISKRMNGMALNFTSICNSAEDIDTSFAERLKNFILRRGD